MTTSQTGQMRLSIPSKIFEEFIQSLADIEISQEAIERLRKVLLEDHQFTERSLNEAIFRDGQSE